MSDGYTPGNGLPIALPVGLNPKSALPQVIKQSGELRGTNTPETSSPELPAKRRRRVDADVLATIAASMPERDREVLERIAEHRYLTTHQVQAFVFTNLGSSESAARTARHVLQRLERNALLRSLKRRVGGVRAGSAARVWQLAPAGARLLRDDGTAHRSHEPSLRFLAHCLAVADVHVALRSLATIDAVHAVTVQCEPDSWRRYTGQAGEPRWLQPDLAAVVTTNDYDDRWFVEVDLGTESLPTLLRKSGQYESYRASGIEQAAHGAFPLVLWVFTEPERAERFRAAVLRSPRLTPQLYRVATVEHFTSVVRGQLA